MKESVWGGDTYLTRVNFYILDVLRIDLIAVLRQNHTAAVIETLDMGPSDTDVNASNHDVAFLLGIDHRFMHAFHGRFKINDLAFAHATRWRLANSEDFNRAIGPAFPND